MFRLLSILLILVLSVERVTSAEYFLPCEGTCELPLDLPCEIMVALYDFEGECCSMSTDENATCILTSNSNCTQIDRLSKCTSSGPGDLQCVAGDSISYIANATSAECPASEIDVLNISGSVTSQWSDLGMLLTGVTEMSDDDISWWTELTSDHIINYYLEEGGDVRDVIGYVGLSNASETETGDFRVTYFQIMSWRTDDDNFDPMTLITTPFMSEKSVANYTQALNDVGIPVEAIELVASVTNGSNAEEGPTVSPAASPTAEEGPTVSPAASPTAEEEGPTVSPAASPTAEEEGPTVSPVASPTAEEEGPTVSPAASPTAEEEGPTISPTASPTPGKVPASPPTAKTPTAGEKPASAGGRVTSTWYGLFVLLVGIVL